MTDSRARFDRIRAALSAADRDLANALEARARAVRELVALRAESPGAYLQLPTADEVLGEVRAHRREHGARALPDEAIEPIFREILGASAMLAAPLRVAIPGPDRSLALLVAREMFGSLAEIVATAQVTDALLAVERQEASSAVIPLETTSDGAISASLFALAHGGGRIVAERTVHNAYHLYSRTGNGSDIEKIYATPSALAACARTLEREHPNATVMEVRSATVAAQLALGDHGSAALATSEEEADGLRVVRAHVEEDATLKTRFVVVAREAPRRTGADRTFLALLLSEEPGSLYAALAPFAERGINLTRLESRQSPGASFEQMFFVELDGHVSDRAVLTALDEVRMKSRHLKVLGSYPRPVR
ncbi:MAG: prephenate dehydratase domain-containing protein [Deltaproteobacteria bacterium]|jgi:chorismate mutase/prephenate dehydratase